ncbi:hypothetical protein AB6A40_001554 [Gnathostoma spinigerum]|uniref:Palmitoyltransferase n=1 Tax=Gnathostoma spinigerum TaxID=75299 RepID=A0ABD6E5F9_9BILA
MGRASRYVCSWIHAIRNLAVNLFCSWLTSYIRFLEIFFKRWLGKFLYYLVFVLLTLVTFSEYLIVLPYEDVVRPSVVLNIYRILGVYFLINIIFHYHKACSVDPGRPIQTHTPPICAVCHWCKPARSHHCSICGRCVLHMDHHCVWINQCVGFYNHRYFIQFITFLWISQILIIYSNCHAFLDHFAKLDRPDEVPFCTEEVAVPWNEFFCANMPNLITSCVCFSFGLAVLLFFVLGGFCAWNFYLISVGETFVDFMQHVDNFKQCGSWRSPYHLSFLLNWQRFLGLVPGKTFIRNILWPSSHLPIFDGFIQTRYHNAISV